MWALRGAGETLGKVPKAACVWLVKFVITSHKLPTDAGTVGHTLARR